jgi:predicted RNA-binding Zn-ribbon protein involved in translation (DUF1610 family)
MTERRPESTGIWIGIEALAFLAILILAYRSRGLSYTEPVPRVVGAVLIAGWAFAPRAFVAMYRSRRARRHEELLVCGRCGYPLHEQARRCPECGQNIGTN